jgi:predicted dinucleotide-binding enzyme
MKIGILGSGTVGQVLARAFSAEGHEVMLGTRNPSKGEIIEFIKNNNELSSGTFEETTKFGELLVLAVKGTATDEALQLSGIANFDNKIVIDATNPIADAAPTNGVLHYFTDLENSLMEKTQKTIPAAKVVKAFNTSSHGVMYKPRFAEGKPTMFICGNDNEAKKTVTDILDTFGWETEDMGPVEAAPAIEPMCILACIPGFTKNQWSNAFKLSTPAPTA